MAPVGPAARSRPEAATHANVASTRATSLPLAASATTRPPAPPTTHIEPHETRAFGSARGTQSAALRRADRCDHPRDLLVERKPEHERCDDGKRTGEPRAHIDAPFLRLEGLAKCVHPRGY